MSVKWPFKLGVLKAMKRIALIAVALVLVVVPAAMITFTDPNAPRFEKLHAPLTLPASARVSYAFLNPSPCDGEKLWITRYWSVTNSETLLYGIHDGTILGRLIHGWPMFLTPGGKLVCARPVADDRHLKERIRGFLQSVAHAFSKSPIRGTPFAASVASRYREPHNYLLLDMKKQTATKMGKLARGPSSFSPSPDFRRGYIYWDTQGGLVDLYCFDLERPAVRQAAAEVLVSGWWDNTHILLQTTNCDFVLHEVTTGQTAPFLRFEEIAEFLRNNGITGDPKKAWAIWFWNGREYDFYLADAQQRWKEAESYLIKLERPAGRFRLLSRQFKFECAGQLDPSARYYLFTGRNERLSNPFTGRNEGLSNESVYFQDILLGRGRDDSVCLRDLENDTTRILVPSAGQSYSGRPRFYRDSVIYYRSNALWRINLDGSNNLKLFPSPDAVGHTPEKSSSR
jgi:hypothetical protein